MFYLVDKKKKSHYKLLRHLHFLLLQLLFVSDEIVLKL